MNIHDVLDAIGEVLAALGEDLTDREILSALCDGEALAMLGITDEKAVVDTYNFIQERRL